MNIVVSTVTKRKGHGSEDNGDYDVFYSGVTEEQRTQEGVATMMPKSLRRFVVNRETINKRIIKTNLNTYGHKITLL